MKNFMRIVAATLLLAAAVSGATSKIIQVNGEGPSPVPLCEPTDPKCKKPIPTEAPTQP